MCGVFVYVYIIPYHEVRVGEPGLHIDAPLDRAPDLVTVHLNFSLCVQPGCANWDHVPEDSN